MTEQRAIEASPLKKITAFTKLDDFVRSHEEVSDTCCDPVRVVSVNSDGALLTEDIPKGKAILYDLLVEEQVEKEQMVPKGWRMMHVEEDDQPVWVEVFTKETYFETEARIETYAVAVE